MFCIKCGNEIKGEMKFCPKCGAELPVIEKKDNADAINTTPINTAPIDNKADSMDEKKFNPIKLLPLVVVVVLIALSVMFISKFSKGTSKNKITDLAVLIDYSEEQVAEAFGCDVNELGMYPNEDNINVTCIDGKAYVVMLNINHEGDSKYTIKGISVGKTLDDEADLLSSFTQDYTYDVVDGIRYVYTEKATGYLLMLDTDATGTIIAASYSWDTSTVDDLSEEPQEEVSLEDKEEIEEVSEIGEYNLPDYCVEAYGPDGMITHYENKQSGYIFGVSDFSTDVIYDEEYYDEVLYKLAILSQYTEVEVVIFEEDEDNTKLEDLMDMYIQTNYDGRGYDSNILVLGEFIREDGYTDYTVYPSTTIKNTFPNGEFDRIFDQIEGNDSISIEFAEVYTKAFEDKLNVETEIYGGMSLDYLCELASLYYGISNDCTGPMADVDSVNGNMVTIQLWEGMDDQKMTYDWYTVDRTTGCGYDITGEEIDITVVERYLGDVGDTTQ